MPARSVAVNDVTIDALEHCGFDVTPHLEKMLGDCKKVGMTLRQSGNDETTIP